jgi:hypothetical protein
MERTTTKGMVCRISGTYVRRALAMRECRWIAVLLAGIIGAGLGASRGAAQSTCPNGFTQFTCPSMPKDVVINEPMCLEANCVLHQIRIEAGGELTVPDEMLKPDAKVIKISATRIIVEGGGVFQAGPLTNNRLTLTFTGPRPDIVVVDRDGPTDPCPSEHFDKGIEVCSGGTLNLLGTKGVPALGGTSWTYLSAPAGRPREVRSDRSATRACSSADQGCCARDATGCANDSACD